MRYKIMLLGLFVATALNFISFAAAWDPRADYEEKQMVHVYRCNECGYASSPGVIARDELCEQIRPRCATVQHEEKRGYLGVLSALVKNSQWWFSVGFLLVFLAAIGIRVYQFSRPRRKPRSRLPAEPKDYDDPEQMAKYLKKLR